MAAVLNRLLSICCFVGLLHITHSQCTSTDTDTCYINRSRTWKPSNANMQCNELPNCVITCSGADLSCSAGEAAPNAHIICPLNAKSCVINCQSAKSCLGATVVATTCKYTEINIGSIDAGKAMTIYSPGSNGGELSINLQNVASDFYASTIRAQQNSSNIHINCDIGHQCTNNTIHALPISANTTSVMLSCNGLNSADCSHTNIYCSQHAFCHMDCAENADSCTGSTLFCGDDFSHLLWDNIKEQWMYEDVIGLCGFGKYVTKEVEYPHSVPISSIVAISTTLDEILSTGPSYTALDVLTSLNPLYYIIFVLTISLCCVVCILMFWMYHQNKFTKELGFNDDIVSKIGDSFDNELAANGAPHTSPQTHMFTRIATTSKKSNTLTGDVCDGCVPHDDGSLILASSPMYNPHYVAEKVNVDDIVLRVKDSQYTSTPIPQYQLNSLRGEVKENEQKTVSIKSPISNLSAVPSLNIHTAHMHANEIDNNVAAHSGEWSESDDNDEICAESAVLSHKNTSNINKHLTQKNKFALPAAYYSTMNMSPKTMAKQIQLTHKQMPIIPISLEQPTQHFQHIQYNINTLTLPVINIQHKKREKSKKHRRRHKNKSVATTIISELTELTELSEAKEGTDKCKQTQSATTDSKEDGFNENEESNTLNTRITYDRSPREITIKSEVLDADIMDTLFGNNIITAFGGVTPLLLDEDCYDDYDLYEDDNTPSPQTVDENDALLHDDDDDVATLEKDKYVD